MANKNTAAQEAAENTNTELSISGQFNPFQDLTDRISLVEEKPDHELIKLTGAEFLKLEEGLVLHMVAAGFTETPNPQTGEPQKTAVLFDKDGKQWYNTHGILISTLSKFPAEQLEAGILIRICVKGKVKGKNNLTYQDMDIFRM